MRVETCSHRCPFWSVWLTIGCCLAQLCWNERLLPTYMGVSPMFGGFRTKKDPLHFGGSPQKDRPLRCKKGALGTCRFSCQFGSRSTSQEVAGGSPWRVATRACLSGRKPGTPRLPGPPTKNTDPSTLENNPAPSGPKNHPEDQESRWHKSSPCFFSHPLTRDSESNSRGG